MKNYLIQKDVKKEVRYFHFSLRKDAFIIPQGESSQTENINHSFT